jgi:hypothetical protein
MSQAVKIILLIASFFPVVIAQVLASQLLSQPVGNHRWLEDNVGFLVFLLAAFQLAIAAFFIWHLRNRSTVPRAQHLNWILQFLFIPIPLGVAGYWYRHIWRAVGTRSNHSSEADGSTAQLKR